MSPLSDLFKSFMKELKEAVDKADEAVKKAASEQKQNAEETEAQKEPAAKTEPAQEYGEDDPYSRVPDEECQYNFGGSYLEYFSKIFREEFPEYAVKLETAESGRRYRYTFSSGAETALVVELMTEKSEANKFRRECRSAGIPYTRFYFDHEGWWNTRSYVVSRVKAALGTL